MQFLIKIQTQDFVAAADIQKELVKLCPNDKTIAEFSKFLPAEVEAQKEAQNEGKDEYYDEEEGEEEDYGEEEPEEAEVPAIEGGDNAN